jgi:hypothetical protein
MAYEPEPRKWEDKDWLYEKYWGELLTVRELSEECGDSQRVIRDQMDDFGIPRRPRGFENGGTISPFSGFYAEDEVAQADEEDRSHFDEDKQSDKDGNWDDWTGAAENELIGEKAHFGET